MQIAATDRSGRRSPLRGFMPFLWLALACLGGIWLAALIPVPVWAWLLATFLSILTFLLTLFLPKRLNITHWLRHWTGAAHRLPGVVVAAVFFIGGLRFAANQVQISPGHVAYYNERGSVQVIGTLAAPPDTREGMSNLVVEAESLALLDGSYQAPLEVHGRVLVQVSALEDYQYGDWLLITGPLETPFEVGDFSYKEYLNRKGIFSVMPYVRVSRLAQGKGNPIRAFLYRLSDRAFTEVHQLFPSPESDLLAGILLGRDQGLSPSLQEAFRRTGTTHIIAISGFNVAILAGLFSGVFTRLLGRKWGALTAVIGITGFTILVGGEAAVVRAAIMGSLGVLGGMFGRRQNGLNSLGLAALLMMLVNPNIPWDIGFQLSAAATLGLVLYAQPLEERFILLASRKMSDEQAQRLVGPVSEFLLFTLAAQLMTLPLIAYHFHDLSIIAVVANPLILPPQALVLILGGLAVMGGMALPGLGAALAVFALPFIRYTIRMVTWLGNLPGGGIIFPRFSTLWLLLFYFLLFALTLLPAEQRQQLRKKIFSYQAGMLLMTGLVILVWNRVLMQPDGHLHLALVDSEGTILITTPHGHSVLIGGGPSPSHLNQVLGEMLPGSRAVVDMLIVGSAAREDLNGLSGALETASIEMGLWGINPEVNQTSRLVYASLVTKGVPITMMEMGQSMDLGDDIRLDVLWTGERGGVLWLAWKDFAALVPAGKVGDEWFEVPGVPNVILLPDDLHIDESTILKIQTWAPSVILFPLREADLPLQGDHTIFAALAGYPLLDTFHHGWIQVSTDGHQVWLRTTHP